MPVRKRPIAILLSALVALAGFGALTPDRPAAAAPSPTIDKVVDPPTMHEFPGTATSHYTSSRYPGRIWTDKTILDQQGLDDATSLLPVKPPRIVLDEDELAVVLSVRGSTRHVSSQVRAPIDLVLVLDNSRSMAQCVTSSDYCDSPTNYTNSRAYAMTEAVNHAIEIIMADNPGNRVGIVQFGTGAGTLYTLATPHVVSGTSRYVTLSAPTTSGGTMTFRTATNSMTIGQVGTTVQSTNIQLGIAVGMGILANQSPADVTGFNQRIPNVLIFTDGEPTLSSTSSTWWDVPISSGTHGPSTPGGVQYYGNGFKAALTASYLKHKITDVYNDPVYNHDMTMAPVSTHVYTVGLGIPGLTTDGRDLALATLDPSGRLGQTDNTMTRGFAAAWKSYTASPTSFTVPVAAGVTFTVQHPSGAVAKYDPSLFKNGMRYNDNAYAPVTTLDLIDVFKTIAQNIVDTSPNFPVEVEAGAPGSSGFITFTDPLGPFMRVTDVSRISLCPPATGVDPGQAMECQHDWFDNPVPTDLGGGVTRYTFEGEAHASWVAGPTDVNQVIVTVRRFQSLARGDEMTVQIPAALLPLRDTQVIVDRDGNPLEMVQHPAHPLHLYFKVAPKPGVLGALADPISLNTSAEQDGTALSAYIAANKAADGKVRFYTNSYEVEADGSIRAGTTASWHPSGLNDYYRFSFDTPLYLDEALTQRLTETQWDAMVADDTVWYYTVEYVYTDDTLTTVKKIHPAQPTTKGLLQAGAAIVKGAGVVAQGGFMVAQADLYDLSRPGKLDHPKCLDLTWQDGNPVCLDPSGNLTGTADMVRDLTYDSEILYTELGNNGYIAAPIPGALTIRKSVREANGLNPDPKATFSIVADIRGEDGQPLAGPFRYTTVDRFDTTKPAASGMYVPGTVLTMRGNQQALIVGLPTGARYTVSEQNLPPGYTLTGVTDPKGTITQDGAASLVVVTNTYEPKPAVVNGAPVVTKTLEGRDWTKADSFKAIMCPEDVTSACEFAQFIPGDTDNGVAAFAPRTFTMPGTYAFMIIEDDDDRAPGISYSDAIYRWTVVVKDNGLGQLTYTESLVRLRDDFSVQPPAPEPSSEAHFLNIYDADEMTFTLTARKTVFDESTDSIRVPRADYDFGFEYLGADLETGNATDIENPPAFLDADGKGVAWTQNSGAQVMSSLLTYVGDHIGHTFYYRGVEQAGSVPNVTYTDTVWYWRVAVQMGVDGAISLDIAHCRAADGSGACDPTVPGNYRPIVEDEREFMNYYDPDPVGVDLAVTKAIDGRPWATDESFSFTLKANDADTVAAIADGSVVMGSTNITITAPVGTTEPVPSTFGTITFLHQGWFQFVVSEDRPSKVPPGMIIDSLPVVYEVVIEDTHHDGKLSAVVTVRDNQPGDQAAHFVNRYRMTTLHEGVDVIKTLTGREPILGEFAFTIKSVDQASCDKALLMSLPPLGECALTVFNGRNGSDPTSTHVQGEFNFTQDDLGKTYTYMAIEENTGSPGVTYDDTVYYAAFEAMYDEATGRIYVVTTFRRDAVDGELAGVYDSRSGVQPTVTFTNDYAAQPVSIEPTFHKTLTGRDWLDDVFTFEWTALSGDVPMPETTLVTLTGADQAEEFSFGPVTFAQAGTYVYSVREVIPDEPVEGMLYDDIAAVITVVVTDGGEGQLVATMSLDGNQQFVNRFAPAWLTLLSTVYNLPGAKDPKDSTHTILVADAGHTTLEGNGTGVNDDGGVERATVPASDYSLSASKLDGYDMGEYGCVGEDESGASVDVTHAEGIVNVPPGTHVICAIEYRPSDGELPPDVPGTPVPHVPAAQTGGRIKEGAAALPIIVCGLAALMVNWRRRLVAASG